MASRDENAVAGGPTSRGRVLLRWSFLLLLVGTTIQGGILFKRLEPQWLPVLKIDINGEVHRHSLAVLQETVADQLGGGIIMADLAAIKRAVEDLPWVASVSVRRVWPERLALRVMEHRPLARWGDDGLVTLAGVVFRPDPATIPEGLPRLTGDDREAGRVVAQYLKWRERLAPLDLRVVALSLDARNAWRLGLHNGLELALGTGHVEERLARFIQAYPSLRLAGRPAAVDMRYANGLAVRWADGGSAERSAAVPAGGGSSRVRS